MAKIPAAKTIIPIAALLMIGGGASAYSIPAGFIIVGSLLWFDLTLWSLKGERTRKTSKS